jgi:Membrane bound O-acyl transferase family
MLRKRLTSIANYGTIFLLRLLHLPHKSSTTISRYTELVLAFSISGLLHKGIEIAQGLRWDEGGALEFFLLMAVGIIVEDMGIWAWGRGVKLGGTRNIILSGEALWWQKTVGYIWVVLFFSWLTPVWAYPSLRRNVDNTASNPLPFSLIGLAKA